MPAEWHSQISAYLVAQRSAGRPETTIYTRRQHLDHAARGLGGDPWAVTADALVQWTAEQEWARATRHGRRTTFRGFWSWGVETGRATVDAAAGLPVVTLGPPSPRPLPAAPLREAVAQADSRVLLILRLATEVGMRRGEIARARTDDLEPDLVGWSLRVHGKGGRDRLVPVTDALAAEIRQHSGDYLFPGREDGHLSARYVGRLAADALPGAWTLHAGRHRFATLAHRESRDLLIVQDLLGHASPVTTRAYVPADTARAREVVNAIPRAA